MGYFPFFMDLAHKNGLIVGGGTLALRKAEKLLPYGPVLTVVAPRLHPALAAIPELTLCQRSFSSQDLEQACFVIAATDDRALNRSIAALCRERNIPVNVVDDRDACTFLFPALIQQGSLSVGISTGGASPTAAVWLKEQILALLPQGLESTLSWLEDLRPLLKSRFPEEAVRSRRFSQLFSACLDAGGPLSPAELERFLQEVSVDG